MSARATLVTGIAMLLLLIAAAAAHGARYDKGDHVLISGRVSGPDGAAITGVTVLLELSHTRFNWRKFRRTSTNTLRIPVTTTVDGQYLHDWRWDGYYNTFALAVGVPVKRGGKDDYGVLARAEITDQLKRGEPATVPLQVEAVSYLDWLRRFLDGRASGDEQRVYQDQGRPDRLDAEAADGSGESAWWYFEAGQVYRFEDGKLDQVEPFDPVKPVE